MKCLLLTATFAALAVNIALADGFTVTGNIPGLPKGCKVMMKSNDANRTELAETVSSDGTFVLTGNVSSPTLSEIRIESGVEGEMDKAFTLMVENLEMNVEVPHFDSIPPSFYVGTPGLEKSRLVKVTGGRAQKELDEYNDWMYPYTYAVKQAHFNGHWDENRDRTKEGKARLKKELSKASIAEAKAEQEFVAKHPGYVISGIKLIGMLRTPFAYSSEELDSLKEAVSVMWDKEMLRKVEEKIKSSREYPRLAPYTDFTLLDIDGNECNLSGNLNPDKYTLIDFWASWCGPCRMAIPHVKELYQQYDGKLDVISVSLDSDEKAWRQAMEVEKMPWLQLWADQPYAKGVTTPYNISGIPFLLLISPDGKIAFGGNDPDLLTSFLFTTLP